MKQAFLIRIPIQCFSDPWGSERDGRARLWRARSKLTVSLLQHIQAVLKRKWQVYLPSVPQEEASKPRVHTPLHPKQGSVRALPNTQEMLLGVHSNQITSFVKSMCQLAWKAARVCPLFTIDSFWANSPDESLVADCFPRNLSWLAGFSKSSTRAVPGNLPSRSVVRRTDVCWIYHRREDDEKRRNQGWGLSYV